MASSPTVSIVTVCLNNLVGLKDTYKSVSSQTTAPHRWIVVDGGSTDGTRQWLEHLACGTWFQWTSEPDRGIYEAMNKGLRRAESDYVLFLNSGDLLAGPDTLQTVHDALSAAADRPALLYGDCYEVDARGRNHLRRARPPFWVPIGMPTTHQAMYFRSDALGSGFDTNYRLSGDYGAVCVLYATGSGADFLRIPVALCHFHLGGRSDQQRSLLLAETRIIRRQVLGMGAAQAGALHFLHVLQGVVKKHLPIFHRLARYG